MGLSDRQGNAVSSKKQNVVKKQPTLRTVYDTLYTEVRSKPQTLIDIATRYRVSIIQAERWVKVLEARKMVELYYPFIGKPIVRIPPKPKAAITPQHNRRKLIIFTLILVIVVALGVVIYLQVLQ
jgi:hypothetical protein